MVACLLAEVLCEEALADWVFHLDLSEGGDESHPQVERQYLVDCLLLCRSSGIVCVDWEPAKNSLQ